jgi:NAD(P)-dependent dehydrogenase (short-subunit alcohol dehydrogenase family)
MGSIVVTGGSKGIGLGVINAIQKSGHSAVIFDSDPAGEEVAAQIGAGFHRVNVTDPGTLATAFKAVAANSGPISGLVNSAGITRTGPSADLSIEDWRLVIDVDLSGTFFACQAAAQYLDESASIVNLASIASTRALPGRVAYTAAKFGVVGITRVLAVEWAERGIRVNAVAPAWTETPLVTELVSAGKIDPDDLAERIPMKRLAKVEDVVSAVMYFLGTQSSFVTGQTLYVDGGYTWAG